MVGRSLRARPSVSPWGNLGGSGNRALSLPLWIDRWDRYRLGHEPVRSLSGLNVQSGHHKCLGGESPRHSRPYEDASGAPLGGEVIPEPLVDGADLPNQRGLWSRGGFALRSGTSFCGFALRSGPCACQSGKGPSRGATAVTQSPKGQTRPTVLHIDTFDWLCEAELAGTTTDKLSYIWVSSQRPFCDAVVSLLLLAFI